MTINIFPSILIQSVMYSHSLIMTSNVTTTKSHSFLTHSQPLTNQFVILIYASFMFTFITLTMITTRQTVAILLICKVNLRYSKAFHDIGDQLNHYLLPLTTK
jgi:hypothetical protein